MTRFVIPILLLSILVAGCDEKESDIFALMPSSKTNIEFTNEIVETPANNIMSYQYMYNGAGVALGDVNNDGFTDIYLVGNSVPSKLFLNRGDWKFEEVTDQMGLAGREGDWKTGVSMVDINGDGWLDIYVCYSGNVQGEGMDAPVQRNRPERSNQLFINSGAVEGELPTFTDQAEAYGLDAIGTFSSQSYFLDYDRDGDLDMFLVNHANMFFAPFFNTTKLRNTRHPYFGNKLYRNEGKTFTEVSEEAGIHGSGLNYGLSASIGDIDGDQWPDIFVTNDYDEQDFLYLNNQDGTFREVSHEAFGHISKFSMGSDIADVNQDGYQDIFVADMLPEDNRRQKLLRGPDKYDKYHLAADSGFHYQNMRNMLHLQAGTEGGEVPRFQEVGQLAGISNSDWSWATLFADYNNDGFLDLYITNGYLHDYTNMDFLRYAQDKIGSVIVASQESHEDIQDLIQKMPSTRLANYCFSGSNELQFENQSTNWGLDEKSISNGAAYGDLDNDGDLDLVVNNLNQPAFVYQNQVAPAENHYLKVKLLGKAPNAQGIGAMVKVELESATLTREAYYSRGYQSSMEPILTFGLGNAAIAKSIRVIWPDGTVSLLENVAANQTLEIDQAKAQHLEMEENQQPASIFHNISAEVGLDFVHQENAFTDFNVQRLAPYALSKLGGKVATGDVNHDGRSDLFFGAPMNQSSSLYLATEDGSYIRSQQKLWDQHASQEDLGATFFDADGDGDQDLYVVSGGNEYPPQHPIYRDRLYTNDGRGNFSLAENALASIEPISGSCVVPFDYDQDGDMDLFVGGRIEPKYYPLSPRSMILRNESSNGSIRFEDVTASLSEDLLRPGMVTDATWQDLNQDGWQDLVLVGEWMPVSVFLNEQGQGFTRETDKMGLGNSQGWWTTITATDLDDDGDMDFLLGNAGTNLQYHASQSEPMEYFVQDINGDQNPDPIMSYFINGVRYPLVAYEDMVGQMSTFRRKFPTYESYSEATIEQIVPQDPSGQSYHFQINELRSCWLENNGGAFEIHPMPQVAQQSMVNGIVVGDFDADGSEEILCVGNFFPYRVEWGPSDSFLGALLKFQDGHLVPYQPQIPMNFPGDIRDATLIETSGSNRRLIVTRNDGPAALYSF